MPAWAAAMTVHSKGAWNMTKQEVTETLDFCNVRYETIDLDDDWQIIVTQHGGHIFGPFSKLYPDGIFWMPESMKTKEKYKEKRHKTGKRSRYLSGSAADKS